MTSFNPTVPIQKLHGELLWTIVKINADMFYDDHALETTRYTSQVCREWRNVMLNASSLWARLIDLDAYSMSKRGSLWRDEVIRRSRDSLMWIKCAKYSISKRVTVFLLDLIDEHWEQIERLIIHTFACDHQFYIHPTRWSSLELPAPCLKEFDVPFWRTMRETARDECPLGPLFSNNAPLLRKYVSRDYPFPSQAHWLRGLHSLTINTPMSVFDILTTLNAAPNLQDLWIGYVMMREGSSLPKVVLAHLGHLKLFTSLSTGCTLLEHVDIPGSCSLDFSARTLEHELSEEIFKRAVQTVLATGARRFFQSIKPNRIMVDLGSSVSFEVESSSDKSIFSFHLWLPWGTTVPDYAMGLLLREFSSMPELSRVTQLYFRVNKKEDNNDNGLDFVTESFVSFCTSLPSIELINADEDTLCFLMNLEIKINKNSEVKRVLLPLLKTIKLDNLGFRCINVYRFILACQEKGYPIALLDITECNPDVSPSLSFLEKFSGLRVLYSKYAVGSHLQQLEYICGSGEPEKLKFQGTIDWNNIRVTRV